MSAGGLMRSRVPWNRIVLGMTLLLLGGVALLASSRTPDALTRRAPEGAREAAPPPLAAGSRSRTEAIGAGVPEDTAASPALLRGFVLEPGGMKVAGARVLATVRRGKTVVESASTTTDQEGAYRLGLPLVATLDASARSVCVTTVTATVGGHEPGRASVSHQTEPQDGLQLDVMLGEVLAQSIVGRVLDVEGKPAVEVAVSVCAEGGVIAFPQTDAEGRFVCAIQTPGAYVVEALDYGRGVARVGPLDVATGATTDVGDLTLRVASVIEGRVELPDGTTPPPLFVTVSPADSADAPPGNCDTSGHSSATQVQSGLDGRFSFRGLRPGRYRVGAIGEPEEDKDTPARVVTADVRDLVLVVRQRFVVVHVVDESGRPFEGSSCSYEEDIEPSGALGAGDFTRSGATHVFQVDHPVALLVDVRAGSLEADVLRVEVPESRWAVEATAVLRPRRHGTIRLELVDGEGRPVAKFRASASMLLDGRRLSMIGNTSWTSKDGMASSPLRPGRYSVAVTRGFEGTVPDAPGGPCFGMHLLEVEVLPGGERVARVVAQAGGWVRVSLLKPDAKDRISAGSSIRREGREADPPIGGMWSDAEKPGKWHALESGRPQLWSQPLAPGRYVLTTKAGGWTEARTPFDIRAGETTDVEVHLTPE